MKSQQGVALVQVLLITGMLLMLMVQISKDARRQVQVATLLKSKAELELKAFSEREKLKYQLLTAKKTQAAGVESQPQLNFSGRSIKLSNQITLNLQDEDGLVSLVYGGESLLKLLGGDEEKFKGLQAYQGADNVTFIPENYRGGLLPEKDELALADLGIGQESLDMVSHLPTFQFNLYNSPEALLRKIYGNDKAQQIIKLQNSGNTSYSQWRDTVAGEEEVAASKLPGNFISATFHAKSDTLEITRKTRIMMNFDQIPYIAEVTIN